VYWIESSKKKQSRNTRQLWTATVDQMAYPCSILALSHKKCENWTCCFLELHQAIRLKWYSHTKMIHCELFNEIDIRKIPELLVKSAYHMLSNLSEYWCRECKVFCVLKLVNWFIISLSAISVTHTFPLMSLPYSLNNSAIHFMNTFS
jgi:hypothetical protein